MNAKIQIRITANEFIRSYSYLYLMWLNSYLDDLCIFQCFEDSVFGDGSHTSC